MSEKLGEALLDLRTNDEGYSKGVSAARKNAIGLGNAMDSAAAKGIAMGGAMQRGAQQSVKALQLNSAQLNQMQFQFNDIAVGLTSGQSPFTVMMQQGSQLAQMFGPGVGLRGALRAIGVGIVSFLVNPLNLAVVGFGLATTAIAGFIRWLGSANDGVEQSGKQIDKLSKAVDALSAAQTSLDRGADGGFGRDYGELAQQAQAVLAINKEIAAFRARQAQQAATQTLAGALNVESALGLDPAAIANSKTAIIEIQAEIDRLSASTYCLSDVDFRAANDRIEELRSKKSALEDVSGSIDQLAKLFGITAQEARQVAIGFAEIGQADGAKMQAEATIRLAEYIQKVSGNLQNAQDEGRTLYEQLVQAALKGLELARVDLASNISAGADEADRLAGAIKNAARALGSLQSRIGDLGMRNIGLSVERAALEAGLGKSEASIQGKVAQRRAEILAQAGGRFEREDVINLNRELTRYEDALRTEAGQLDRISELSRTPSEGGAARSATVKQQDAIAKLIDGLKAEQALMARTDPAQRRMIELREQLAGATGAQRDQVEQLIFAIEKERAAMQASAEASQFFGDTIFAALDAAIYQGKKAGQIFADLLIQISRMALQSALMGQGALAGKMGAKGTNTLGDLAMGAFDKLFAGFFADGGLIPNGTFGIVGENGPEPVFATAGGIGVLPNSGLRDTQGGGSNVTVNIAARDVQSFRRARAEVTGDITRAVAAGQRTT